MVIYTVKKGDRLRSIAKKFRVDLGKLREINSLLGDLVTPGTTLAIPTEMSAHEVMDGDSLYSVSLMYGCSIEEIINLNPHLKPSYSPSGGEYIIVPPQNYIGKLAVIGRLSPNIRTEVLNSWLPSLTMVSLCCGELSLDGVLSTTPCRELVTLALKGNVAPIFHLSPKTSVKPAANHEPLTDIFNNPEALDRLCDEMPDFLKRSGFMGMELNLGRIPTALEQEYRKLLHRIEKRLAEEGLIFKSNEMFFDGSVLPHFEKFGGNSFTESLSEYWDNEWQPPGAISPIIYTEKALRNAMKLLPSHELLLTVKTGGCDWSLPYRPSSPARLLSSIAAHNLAKSTHRDMEYNSTSDTPYFTYRDGSGREHIVWLNDLRSLRTRLKLAVAHSIRGISLSSINAAWPAAAYTISHTVEVEKLI